VPTLRIDYPAVEDVFALLVDSLGPSSLLPSIDVLLMGPLQTPFHAGCRLRLIFFAFVSFGEAGLSQTVPCFYFLALLLATRALPGLRSVQCSFCPRLRCFRSHLLIFLWSDHVSRGPEVLKFRYGELNFLPIVLFLHRACFFLPEAC